MNTCTGCGAIIKRGTTAACPMRKSCGERTFACSFAFCRECANDSTILPSCFRQKTSAVHEIDAGEMVAYLRELGCFETVVDADPGHIYNVGRDSRYSEEIVVRGPYHNDDIASLQDGDLRDAVMIFAPRGENQARLHYAKEMMV